MMDCPIVPQIGRISRTQERKHRARFSGNQPDYPGCEGVWRPSGEDVSGGRPTPGHPRGMEWSPCRKGPAPGGVRPALPGDCRIQGGLSDSPHPGNPLEECRGRPQPRSSLSCGRVSDDPLPPWQETGLTGWTSDREDVRSPPLSLKGTDWFPL